MLCREMLMHECHIVHDVIVGRSPDIAIDSWRCSPFWQLSAAVKEGALGSHRQPHSADEVKMVNLFNENAGSRRVYVTSHRSTFATVCRYRFYALPVHAGVHSCSDPRPPV